MKRNHLQWSVTRLMKISMCCVAYLCGLLNVPEDRTVNTNSGLKDISVPKCTLMVRSCKFWGFSATETILYADTPPPVLWSASLIENSCTVCGVRASYSFHVLGCTQVMYCHFLWSRDSLKTAWSSKLPGLMGSKWWFDCLHTIMHAYLSIFYQFQLYKLACLHEFRCFV